jgi:hypothetical protein
LEVSRVDTLPSSADPGQMADMLHQIRTRSSDDAMVAFKRLVYATPDVSTEDWLTTVAWLTQQVHLADTPQALAAGADLNRRLRRVRELEAAVQTESDVDQLDELQQTLAKARGGLSLSRADIASHSSEWRLRRVKTMLRGYREVARVASSPH